MANLMVVCPNEVISVMPLFAHTRLLLTWCGSGGSLRKRWCRGCLLAWPLGQSSVGTPCSHTQRTRLHLAHCLLSFLLQVKCPQPSPPFPVCLAPVLYQSLLTDSVSSQVSVPHEVRFPPGSSGRAALADALRSYDLLSIAPISQCFSPESLTSVFPSVRWRENTQIKQTYTVFPMHTLLLLLSSPSLLLMGHILLIVSSSI